MPALRPGLPLRRRSGGWPVLGLLEENIAVVEVEAENEQRRFPVQARRDENAGAVLSVAFNRLTG